MTERSDDKPSRLCHEGETHGEQYHYVLDGAKVCVKCVSLTAWHGKGLPSSARERVMELAGYIAKFPGGFALRQELEALMLARRQFEDNPDSALDEIEHRVSKLLESIGQVSAPSATRRTVPTEEMTDAVRGILQILRGKPGATFEDVMFHCEHRGEDLMKWPLWARESTGYVNETAAACLLFELMATTDGGGAKARPCPTCGFDAVQCECGDV